MGISRRALLTEAQSLLEEPLQTRGYTFYRLPPGGKEDLSAGRWEFSFEKESDGLHHIIQFNPTGISVEELFDLAVILYRATFRDPFRPPPDGKIHFRGSLALFFLDRLDDPLQRWHFADAEGLRKSYADILNRLMDYGITFLENPRTTWEHWVGRKSYPASSE
jgi:hypothetical protein